MFIDGLNEVVSVVASMISSWTSTSELHFVEATEFDEVAEASQYHISHFDFKEFFIRCNGTKSLFYLYFVLI